MDLLTTNKPGEATPEWKGYTLEELMYQRAYTTARLEIQKQRIVSNIHRLQNGGGTSVGNTLMGRLMSGFSYFDIGLFAFKIGRRIFKSIRRLRG